jgi:hypothetical protein
MAADKQGRIWEKMMSKEAADRRSWRCMSQHGEQYLDAGRLLREKNVELAPKCQLLHRQIGCH